MSTSTEQSFYQREEIAHAIHLARQQPPRHRVVPIYLDDVSIGKDALPYGLRLKHGISVVATGGIGQVAAKLLSMRVRRPRVARRRVVAETQAPPPPAPQYFCYISHDKVTQLLADAPRRVSGSEAGGVSQLMSTANSYGRGDLFLTQPDVRAAWIEKLRSAIERHAAAIREFEWSPSNDSLLFHVQASFHVEKIDGEDQVATLVTRHGRARLTLHSSLKYFSDALDSGKLQLHSTNFAFFRDRMPIHFDVVFVLLSATAEKFVGSPVYLKLAAQRGLVL